ncbi:tRNA threonylcarbamoyladenosine dehydratase [Anaerovorax odorimutans]|uniref:tRNA threonylcarbamoyladenosine dehydratase n=1 Tax=Anaerovorax odorimutans TaxID=109327 RepID=UPI0003F98A66|nr:tRNA threonylcarbamoyladenosine dehydratase [Anaerovorax odorimutans]
MQTIFNRTCMLIGTEKMKEINNQKIIIFGIGGVGGYVVESLVRAGIEKIAIVDYDVVDITNINRQIIALHSTVNRLKTEVMADRIKDINPDAEIKIFDYKLGEENIDLFNLEKYDYIVDAIDDVKAKLLLIKRAKELNVPIISSMGTGNKLDPSKFKIADISKTHTCPLARVIRRELAKNNIKKLKVLFSSEQPYKVESFDTYNKVPSSISFVPASAGLLIASEVFLDLLLKNK